MNIKKSEIVNYIIALAAMITFIADAFTKYMFNIRVICVFFADISFFVVSKIEKIKDKSVIVLDTIVFAVLTFINICILLTGRYLGELNGSLLIIIIYVLIIPISSILLTKGYINRITHNVFRRTLDNKIVVNPIENRNKYSNTEIELEYIKNLKNSN